MFLNDTLVMLMVTANMMATIPNGTETDSRQIKDQIPLINSTTTTLSPEEQENKFDFEDGKSFYSFNKFIFDFWSRVNDKKFLFLFIKLDKILLLNKFLPY